MSKIRVCHICNMGMNGKAIFVCNLLEHTDYERYDVTVINYRTSYVKSVVSRLEKLPVSIITPPKGNVLTFCRFLNVFFQQNRFDVCHAHMWDQSGLFLLIAHIRGIPVRVAHSHNTSKVKDRYGRFKTLIRDTLIWTVLRNMISAHANRFVACSEEAAQWLFPASVIRKKQYVIVPNGVDLALFACPNRQKHSPTKILFAGRLAIQKNPLFAIQVFHAYLQQDPDARMTMIGRGNLEKTVREEIARLGIEKRIDIILETDHMPDFYQSADVFLFPSFYEGLGMTLIEAQASGLKCLASDAVPIEAQCGLVVFKPLNDGPLKWAQYITDLLRDDSMAIEKTKLTRYDAKNTAKIMDRIYTLSDKGRK